MKLESFHTHSAILERTFHDAIYKKIEGIFLRKDDLDFALRVAHPYHSIGQSHPISLLYPLGYNKI